MVVVLADLVDDPSGVEEARQAARDGGFGEALDSADVVVEEFVFTSPTEAWFRYRIDTSSGTFDDRYGTAVSVDGDWKITKATICQDVQMAGGICGDDYYEVHSATGILISPID